MGKLTIYMQELKPIFCRHVKVSFMPYPENTKYLTIHEQVYFHRRRFADAVKLAQEDIFWYRGALMEQHEAQNCIQWQPCLIFS